MEFGLFNLTKTPPHTTKYRNQGAKWTRCAIEVSAQSHLLL